MLVTQRDDGFVESFRKTLEGTLYVNTFDSNGKNVYDVRVKKYPQSVAKCSDEDKEEIYCNVPIDGFSKIAGEDHLYYFAYNSFGNNSEITDELYNFIGQIKRETLDATVDGLTNVILRNCTTMWSLVPEAYYDEAVSRVLPGEENAEMRRQVEVYHHAQVNRFANIEKMRAAGAEVFDIVDYDYQLYCLVPSYDKSNADGIIHAESTSMGAKFAKIGETLGEGYVQQGTHCKNTAHNHLSPDGVVDASVGLLPDYTFYFKGQDHEKTGSNDVIMKLATELLTNPEFKDVYSMPDRFPQFNIGRNTKDLVNNLMKPAQEIDRSTLSPEDAAELDAALEECNAMLDNTVVDPAATEHAQKRLENILIKIGEREAPNENEEKLSAVGEAISKFISDALYECVGAQGYYDAFQQLLELIGKYFPQPA